MEYPIGGNAVHPIVIFPYENITIGNIQYIYCILYILYIIGILILTMVAAESLALS